MTDQKNPFESWPQADIDEAKAALQTWRNEGVLDPRIPLDVDIDGDGIVDALGLDADGELVLIPGVALTETVYEATGETPEDGE